MIELECELASPPDQLWEKLVQPELIHKWWESEVVFNPVLSSAFQESFNDDDEVCHHVLGSLTAIDPTRRIQIDYQEQGWPAKTRLEFFLTPQKTGSRLCLQHSGWEIFTNEEERRKVVDLYTIKWQKALKRLKGIC